MTAQQFSNNAQTTLAGNGGSITSGATNFKVASATAFPATNPFTVVVGPLVNGVITNGEFMLIGGGAGTVNWTSIARGQEGTTAAPHNDGEGVVQVWTKAGLDSLNDGYWPFLRPSGLTGATALTRFVGGTASGAPITGTFQQGDFTIDRTTGAIWICTVAGTPGTWATSSPPYRARMYLNGTQTLAQGTWTNINFDTVDFDGASMASSGANAHLTAPVTGTYLIEASYVIPSATGATRVICDVAASAFTGGYTGTGGYRLSDQLYPGGAGSFYTGGGRVTLALTAGNSVYAGAFQTSVGVNFLAGVAPQNTWFSMSLLARG